MRARRAGRNNRYEIGEKRSDRASERGGLHLGDEVVVGCEQTHDGVSRLVVGHELLPRWEGHAGGLLHADGHAVEGVVDLLVPEKGRSVGSGGWGMVRER